MFKKFRVLLFVILLLGIFAGTASAYEIFFKDVAVIDDGQLTRFRTTCDTVAEFFEKENITVKENDKVSANLEDELYPGFEISIERGFMVSVIVDSDIKTMAINKGTKVGNIIALLPEQENMEYIYDGIYSEDVVKGQPIRLKTKRTEKIVTYEELPFETVYEEDSEALEGTEKVVSEGSVGQKEIITEVIYISEVETSREIISDTVKISPADKVISKGTKKKQVVETNTSQFEYKKVYTMTATAYTNSYADTGKGPGDKYFGITASGMRAQRGVVAVDPRVIPLGTKLYIEGYGHAVAGDTGGSIKGNKIDLFLDTYSECINFGRRSVTVYVL